MKAKTNTTATTTARVYEELERDTAAVLRNAASRTYTPIIRELQNAAANDRDARNAPAIVEQINDLEKMHDSHTKGAAHFDTIARRLKATAEERATAAALAADFRAKAANERRQIDTLYSALDTTYSDRADITQEIAAATLEQPTEKEQAAAEEFAPARAIKYAESRESQSATAWKYLNAAAAAIVFIEQDEDTRAAVIAADAARRHRQNAGGRYIRSMRGICALDTYHTDSEPATAEMCAAWLAAGHLLDSDRENTNGVIKYCAGYKYTTDTHSVSIEYREKDKRGAGWYKVTRRRTVKAGNSYEEMTDNGETIATKHTRNTYADSLAAIEQIEDIITRAALTVRERRFLETFCTAAARKAGEDSRAAYMNSTAAQAIAPSRRKAAANRIQYAGRVEYCFNVLDIKTAAAKDHFSRRLREKVKAADTRTTDSTNAPTLTPHKFEYFKHLTESNRGTAATDNAPRADLLAWIFNK